MTEIQVRLTVDGREYAIGANVDKGKLGDVELTAQRLSAYLERTLLLVLTEVQP